jgi:hypothetical protein
MEKKHYPLNYSQDVLNVINALAYDPKTVTIAGSMALRSQLYAGDYDLFEVVRSSAASRDKAVAEFVRGFQKNIQQLLDLPECYVGDIKAGIIEEWRVVEGDVRGGRVVGYSAAASRKKVDALVESGVLTTEEGPEAKAALRNSPSPTQFMEIQKTVRPEIIRWSVADIRRGYCTLRTGKRFTLAEAIQTPAVAKVDAVSLVQKNRFTDFSILYQFVWKGTVLNNVKMDPVHEIKKNIALYAATGDTYKMAKRIYALEKNSDGPIVQKLNAMFNGDLGRLYSIISDIGSMLFLLENESSVPLEKIRYEVGQFRARLGNIFETDRVNTERILMDILSLETADRSRLRKGLERLDERLRKELNTNASRTLKTIGLLPVPKRFNP